MRYLITTSLALFAFAAAAQSTPPNFARDIAPIFEQHCVRCHRPEARKGDLSLATADDALASGNVTPGKPDQSPLLDLLVATAPGARPKMPKAGHPLEAPQVDALRRWVAAGAVWPKGVVLRDASRADESWWSLRPVRAAGPPALDAAAPGAWAANPIDRFVYAGLAAKGLRPSPEADRRTLIRRLSFDLLGLPPAPEDVAAFVADPAADAYEKLVDRLLASPHFGERWARHWLDVAHYADTHGFERDQLREHAYPYRDYVIRAMNADVPYDRFLREQIAGDVLAPQDPAAVAATGFLAAGPWDFVGQVETASPALRRAARGDDLDDMVTTVMATTVGLTVNCARCHDHKLDPIPQRDYYRLWAVFAGVKRGERVLDAGPDVAADRGRLERDLAAARARRDHLLGKPIDLADAVAVVTGDRKIGIDPRTGRPQKQAVAIFDGPANRYAKIARGLIDGVVIPGGGDVPISSTGLLVKALPKTSAQGWDAIRATAVAQQKSTRVGETDYAAAGHSMLAVHANAAITFDLSAARGAGAPTSFRFTATAGYGGRPPANDTRADVRVFVDGVPKFERTALAPGDSAGIDLSLGADARFLTLMATDGGDGIAHDQVFFGDPHLYPAADTPDPEAAAQAAALDAAVEQLESRLRSLPRPTKFYGVTAEPPPPVHVLTRGDAESPAEAVTPGAVSCVRGLPANFGDEKTTDAQRRVALAEWVTSPSNPLTPRVIVNRLWHHHFGTGIVDTPSDFGFGGGRPSHPELLDYLAGELIRQKWSLKAIHRLIVTSQAYRQSSAAPPDAAGARVDAGNRLMWRASPRRLDAESFRDAVLATTGKLNPEMYGPGFRDFKYAEAYAPIYEYVTPDAPPVWRRSVYRFVVRATPQPFMTTLDCPNPSNRTPARVGTNTALQALALLNNDFMLRQSRYLAERAGREAGPELTRQVGRAFQLAFGRPPGAEESAAAVRLAERHGMAAVCRMLLNGNEFAFVD